MTYAEVGLFGKTGGRRLRLLVDTGSLLTWVSKDTLLGIGVGPSGRRRFRTIEGRELSRETGEAVLEVMGERATRIVVFGAPGDREVLGADALEGLGLEVDPATKELRKTDVFVAYAATAQVVR
jgi:predicted aspartyl protease